MFCLFFEFEIDQVEALVVEFIADDVVFFVVFEIFEKRHKLLRCHSSSRLAFSVEDFIVEKGYFLV